MQKTLEIELKELRNKIAQQIQEKRKPYLELCNDKQSEDYNFYLGLCNGMNYAMLIAEGNRDN